MSNALATIDLNQLPSTQLGSDEACAELTQGGDYLTSIKLCSTDKYVKRNLIPNGHFGIPRSNDDIDDLGESIDILPLASRPKAVDMSDKSAVVVSYDTDSTTFRNIKDRSKVKDSNCVSGLSFLVIERSTGQFYEYFFGSSSSHREAKLVLGCAPLSQADIDRKIAGGALGMEDAEPHGPIPVTLKSKYIETAKFSWYGPVATKCSQPFSKVPPMSAIVREINKFLTAKSGGVEKAVDTRKQRAH